jgi:hypothetical protein
MDRHAIQEVVAVAREKLKDSGVQVKEGRGKKKLTATLPTIQQIANLPMSKVHPTHAAAAAKAIGPQVEAARRNYENAKVRAHYAFTEYGARQARAKVIEKLRGVEAATTGRNVARAEEGRKVKAAREASVASTSSNSSASSTSSTEHIDKLRSDPFMIKAFDKDLPSTLELLERIASGKVAPMKDKSYDGPIYDLGEFYSRKWPMNSNNLQVPKSTVAHISKIPGLSDMFVYDTGDSDAYGRYNDVIMVVKGVKR